MYTLFVYSGNEFAETEYDTYIQFSYLCAYTYAYTYKAKSFRRNFLFKNNFSRAVHLPGMPEHR